MKILVKYLLQGLLFVVPISVTLYVLFFIASKLDKIIPYEDLPIPGLGILTVLGIIVLVGYLSNTIVFKPVFKAFDDLLNKIPMAKMIYSSLKDLVNAFVGSKKKFEYPVMVIMNKEAEIKKMGFVSQNNLEDIGLEEDVAVYMPHSYNFSGNMFLIPRKNIIEIKGMSSSQAMKFIVSGGMAGLNNDGEGETGI